MKSPVFPLLVRLFSRRFFENDLLAPDIDLRPSAIWLLAALAMPPLLWTVKSIVPYGLMAIHGYALMESVSWFDKSLLMMLAMVSAGIVTVLSWEALLVDRRDALVLGALPVAPLPIVAAKAAAIARLFAVVAALNLPGAFILSLAVYGHWGFLLMLRAIAAHVVAVTAASLATSLALTAALVAVTSLFEGRWLRVMTVAMQAAVLGVLAGLLVGIQWSPALLAAARNADPSLLGAVAYWPPAWFVGLYQQILGVHLGSEVFGPLAAHALTTLGVVTLVGVPLTLWLWQRALRELVSAASEPVGSDLRSLARHVPRWLAAPARDRAFLQFFLTVLWRSPRHRLALLTGFGLSTMVAVQGTLVLTARASASRWLTEFAAPVLALLCLLAFLRWLLLLPAELPASWVLGLASPAPGPLVRRAVARVMWLLVVAPPTLLALLLSWWQGGIASALAHATLVAAFGLCLVERALAKISFMPFATEYLPGRSNLKARWPVHAVVLLIVVPTLAEIERRLVARPSVAFAVITLMLLAVAALAAAYRRRNHDELTADPGIGTDWTPVQLRLAGI